VGPISPQERGDGGEIVGRMQISISKSNGDFNSGIIIG
jgi:hypothetical protein